MAILSFHAASVRRVIDHAKSAPEHQMSWTEHLPQPAVILAGDQGVYLMSNGLPSDKRADAPERNFVAHALGMNPKIDPDWYEAKRTSYGRSHGEDLLLIVDTLELLLGRGETFVQIEITEDQIGVLVPNFSWIKEDVLIETPSGLGGIFRARVLSITETHATVQNTGNSEDFDEMPPYAVPFAQLRPVQPKEAA